MATLPSEFFQGVLARLNVTDVAIYTWVMGRAPGTDQTSCCTGPFIDDSGRPCTVGKDDPLVIAASLAFAYAGMIDPQGFHFGIVHGVAASNLVLFDAQINHWIAQWMTGPAKFCEYPRHLLESVIAVSFQPNHSEPAPPSLPLKKWLPS